VDLVKEEIRASGQYFFAFFLLIEHVKVRVSAFFKARIGWRMSDRIGKDTQLKNYSQARIFSWSFIPNLNQEEIRASGQYFFCVLLFN